MVVAVEASNCKYRFLRAIWCDNQETPDHVDKTTQEKADRADPKEDKGQVSVVVLATLRAVLSVHPSLPNKVDDGDQSDNHEEAVHYEEKYYLILRPQQYVILLSWFLETFADIYVFSQSSHYFILF